MPIRPFNGVRISWLTAARKRLLARLAERAASLASINAVSRASWAESFQTVPINSGASASKTAARVASRRVEGPFRCREPPLAVGLSDLSRANERPPTRFAGYY